MYDFGWQFNGEKGLVIPKWFVGPQRCEKQKELVHTGMEKEPVCKQPCLEIHQEDEKDGTSTVNLHEETSEISHELEYMYFGEFDDGGENLSDSDYDDYIYHNFIISILHLIFFSLERVSHVKTSVNAINLLFILIF